MNAMKTTTWTQMLAAVLCHLLTLHEAIATKGLAFRLPQRKDLKKTVTPRRELIMDNYDGLYGEYDIVDWDYHFQLNAYRKHKTSKSCSGKGKGEGKGRLCGPTASPTASPSTVPSVSVSPSFKPSRSPTDYPTSSPSEMPSVNPTKSLMPSVYPSATPTVEPSSSPSRMPTIVPSSTPSTTPTQSLVPSSSPSSRPSSAPTATPSLYPSTGPSSTPSSGPSSTPSSGPSEFPSLYPSQILVETERSEGLVTRCIEEPPDNLGVLQEQSVAFQYNLYIATDAVFREETAIMESILHDGLSQEFLTCDYESGSDFYVVAISADPNDQLLSRSLCDTTSDPPPPPDSMCGVVGSELTVTVYFPNSRRILQMTNASPEVLTATGDYLDNAMGNGDFETDDILMVTFQGFVNTQHPGRESPPASGGNGIAGIIGNSDQPPNITDNSLALGGAVVGIAAVILLVMLIMGGRRRKHRQEAYLKHLEEMSVSDTSDEQPPDHLGDGRVRLVLDDSDFTSVNESSEWDTTGGILRDLNNAEADRHDVRNCSSATCPVCRSRELYPTFIDAPPLGHSIADIHRLQKIMEIRQSYRSPDTVDL